jgi:YHS domain-containing protein
LRTWLQRGAVERRVRGGVTAQTVRGRGMAMVTDPVCATRIESDEAADTAEYEGSRYYFCSQACQDAFVADPGAFNSAETHTCRTSGPSPRPIVPSSSTSMTSTRRFRDRGSGTSSASPRASPLLVGIAPSPRAIADRSWPRPSPSTEPRCEILRVCRTSTSGTRGWMRVSSCVGGHPTWEAKASAGCSELRSGRDPRTAFAR